MASNTGGRTVRVDAQRNRARLIEVARRAFGTGDGKVPLEAIARAAGVGIGTLYRHFPTREDLVEAVYRAERSRLCDSVDELLAEQPPDRALRSWMDRFSDYMAAKREMSDALRALIAAGAITSAQAHAELSSAVRRLLDAGVAAGSLRPDVPAEDVVTGLLGVALACAGPERSDQTGRLFDLLLDGLRRPTPS
jgi:AcrR family transcriptional regulator